MIGNHRILDVRETGSGSGGGLGERVEIGMENGE